MDMRTVFVVVLTQTLVIGRLVAAPTPPTTLNITAPAMTIPSVLRARPPGVNEAMCHSNTRDPCDGPVKMT
jgi:hypothetical protein